MPSVSSVKVTWPRTLPFGAGLRTATAVERVFADGAAESFSVRLVELLAQPAPNAIQLTRISEWTNGFIKNFPSRPACLPRDLISPWPNSYQLHTNAQAPAPHKKTCRRSLSSCPSRRGELP